MQRRYIIGIKRKNLSTGPVRLAELSGLIAPSGISE
jgi:hypothetical protein